MLLAFDIGNTNTVIGLYDGKKMVGHWRIATDKQKTSDEYGILIHKLFDFHQVDPSKVTSIIFSSVVPTIVRTLTNMAETYFRITPIIVGAGIKTGMPIRCENPREVGADRIVNAVAGYEKYGGPLIIVDFGTATTFCCITAEGDYRGGAIAPGINISIDALFQNTSKLPRVELTVPKQVIGKNTITAIQSGLTYGYSGLVDGLVKRMTAELGYDKVKVVATGGLAKVISDFTSSIDIVDQYLTLEGLRIIYDRNK